MDEYGNKFLELLKYVPYIRHEKVNIQRFLSGLPQAYKDRIEFYEPRTLEEVIRLIIAMNKAKVNLIIIRHGRTRRMRSLTKEGKVSNLLDLGISKSIHPKLRVI